MRTDIRTWIAVALAVLAWGTAGCVPTVPPRSADVPAPEGPWAALEHSVHARVNAFRAEHGLQRLTYDAEIAAIARAHSRAMAAGDRPFGHGQFDERASAVGNVVAYRSIAENLAWNDFPPAQMPEVTVRGWRESPGHRANMEGAYDVTGVGVARSPTGVFFTTQLFVRRAGR